jgi:hypothetical protein
MNKVSGQMHSPAGLLLGIGAPGYLLNRREGGPQNRYERGVQRSCFVIKKLKD